jgi:hypothetical protein
MASVDSTEQFDQLVQALLDDPEIAVAHWQGVVIAGVVADGWRSLSGYAFDAAGQEEAVAPRGGIAMRCLQALNDAMFATSGLRWQACLLSVRRGETPQAEFEYGDAARWVITPATLETRIAQFRALVM